MSFSSFMISSLSLKKGGSDLFLLFLDTISLIVFHVFLISYFEFKAFTMYTMGYYTSFNHQLLQNAVLHPKNGVRSVNLPIPAKTSKLMSYGSRGVDASDTTIGLSNFSANQR